MVTVETTTVPPEIAGGETSVGVRVLRHERSRQPLVKASLLRFGPIVMGSPCCLGTKSTRRWILGRWWRSALSPARDSGILSVVVEAVPRSRETVRKPLPPTEIRPAALIRTVRMSLRRTITPRTILAPQPVAEIGMLCLM